MQRRQDQGTTASADLFKLFHAGTPAILLPPWLAEPVGPRTEQLRQLHLGTPLPNAPNPGRPSPKGSKGRGKSVELLNAWLRTGQLPARCDGSGRPQQHPQAPRGEKAFCHPQPTAKKQTNDLFDG